MTKTSSVRLRVRELCGGEADLVVPRVEHVVESLEERHAVDKVEPFAAVGSEVAHDEEDRVGVPTNRRVELSTAESKPSRGLGGKNQGVRAGESTHRPRPRLGVWSELERILGRGRVVSGKDSAGKPSTTYVADLEEQALEVTELLRREAQQSNVVVEDSAGELLVSGERI